MWHSLRGRLLISVSILGIAAVAAAALSARRSTRVEFRKFQDLEMRSLDAAAPASASNIARDLAAGCCSPADLARAAATVGPQEIVLVIDARGAVVATGGPRAHELSRVSAHVAGGVTTVEYERTRDGRTDSASLRFKGLTPVPLALPDGRTATVHVLRLPEDGAAPAAAVFLGSLDRRLLIATVVISLGVIGVTWTIARRIGAPLAALSRAAGDLAAGDLTRRVAVRGDDEIARLGRSFNAMAAALEQQRAVERGLVHDVAHELRTPLTALQCRLETVLDGMAADPGGALTNAHHEVRHLTRLVDDLEMVALAEARQIALSPSPVRIAEIAASAAAAISGAPGRVHIDVPSDLTVTADPVRLRQVLLNLLTNADRHTPPDGTITIRSRRVADEIVTDVHNPGSSLAPAALVRVFDRFYRADPSRQRATGGAGLGLAIVKHLIEAHGGRATAASDATGVTFTCVLPAAAAPAPRPGSEPRR